MEGLIMNEKRLDKSLNSGERQVADTFSKIEEWHKWRYLQACGYLKGTESVLDVCCGCGYGSNMLSLKAGLVYGVDNCEGAIRYALDNWKRDNSYFKHMDIFKLTTGIMYDTVVAFEAIEHIENEAKIWKFLADKTKSTLIYSVPHISVPVTISPWHYRHYTVERCKEMLSLNGMKSLRLEEVTGRNGKKFIFGVAMK